MSHVQHSMFSRRMSQLRPSCVREMMKRAGSADVISFAAGMPRADLFPVKAIAQAAADVLNDSGQDALQYTSTEGYAPLRQYVAENILACEGIAADADDILLTSGSQQGLDLVGKILLDRHDTVLMERPTYLAAIQAFGLYEPRFVSAPLDDDGIDVGQLRRQLAKHRPRMFYAVPTFHNPTGVSYSDACRRATAEALSHSDTVLVEDMPYSELLYEGQPQRPICSLASCRRILLGTFSKTVSPGLRMGWVWSDRGMIAQLALAKQASDLCSNYLGQRILHRFLATNRLADHVAVLRREYAYQRDAMLEALSDLMPAGVSWTRPRGGMFVWVTLPERLNASVLLERVLPLGVVFATGESFYADRPAVNTLRLNFTHASAAQMRRGVAILAQEICLMS